MSKNIVILFDGTWDKPSKPTDKIDTSTNVFHLSEMCINDENNGQITFYDDGVGTDWYDKYTGGIMGAGLSQKIKDGYKWLCQKYQQGDKVFIFGFSRGAYTARSLAGMVNACGLVPSQYSQDDKVVNLMFDTYKNKTESSYSYIKNLLDNANIKCIIEMVGVWDTVGALGIPVGLLKDPSANFFKFCDKSLSRNIKNAYHAVSIDEQREAFEPTLWDKNSVQPDQHLEQVWFPGEHSDVGGGNVVTNFFSQPIGVDRSHSDLPFEWMVNKAVGHGLQVDKSKYDFNYDVTKKFKCNYSRIFGKKNPRNADIASLVTDKILDKMAALSDYTPLALKLLIDRVKLTPYELTETP